MQLNILSPVRERISWSNCSIRNGPAYFRAKMAFATLAMTPTTTLHELLKCVLHTFGTLEKITLLNFRHHYPHFRVAACLCKQWLADFAHSARALFFHFFSNFSRAKNSRQIIIHHWSTQQVWNYRYRNDGVFVIMTNAAFRCGVIICLSGSTYAICLLLYVLLMANL